LNDAKLYVLESRIIEEEKVRLKEFQIVQENLVKLVYAFQQELEAQNKPVEPRKAAPDIVSPKNSGAFELPSLDRVKTHSAFFSPKAKSKVAQSMDFSSGEGLGKSAKGSSGTHLKRLQQIKSALESYDPNNVMEAAVRKLKEKFNTESRVTELYKRSVHTEDVIGKLVDENRLKK
jgi:hypothetical protein